MYPLIRRSWEGSGRVYGYSKLGNDLRNTTLVLPNYLDRQFEPAEPNKVWATDITYIGTHEGCLYLAVVLDLFSRQVVGWSMGSACPGIWRSTRCSWPSCDANRREG